MRVDEEEVFEGAVREQDVPPEVIVVNEVSLMEPAGAGGEVFDQRSSGPPSQVPGQRRQKIPDVFVQRRRRRNFFADEIGTHQPAGLALLANGHRLWSIKPKAAEQVEVVKFPARFRAAEERAAEHAAPELLWPADPVFLDEERRSRRASAKDHAADFRAAALGDDVACGAAIHAFDIGQIVIVKQGFKTGSDQVGLAAQHWRAN